MNDFIERQAAIDEIDEWIKAFRENGHKESAADACLIQDGIIQLPSAQPEIIHCKDCKHGMYDVMCKFYWCHGVAHSANWYCADAERRTDG